MNKKALSSTLVAIIIAIISGLVIMGIVLPAMNQAREGQAESLCKTSVVIRAATALKPGGNVEAHTSPILCKTLTPEIKEDREHISRAVADKMAKCWEMFGAGTYPDSVFNTFNIFGGGKGCFTCYVLAVEETRGFKERRDNIPGAEFIDFLRTANYSVDSNRTYLNYFQTAGGPGNVLNLLTEKGIEPNHAYAISYKVSKGTCPWCGAALGGAITAGGAAVTLLGALLLAVPEPTGVTKVAGVSLVVKGVAVATTGSILLGYGTHAAVDVLNEAAIDTIILSDITDSGMEAQVRQACNFVGDIEGKKLR